MEKEESNITEYNSVVEQIQQVQEYLSNLERHLAELNSLSDSLKKSSELRADSEVLVSLGSGIFSRGFLSDTKKLIMNVGAGVCVEKSAEDCLEIVKRQITEVNSVFSQMQINLNFLLLREKELRKK